MIKIIKLELKKIYFSDILSIYHFFTLFLLPLLSFGSIYYGFLSFPLNKFKKYGIVGEQNVFLFLLLGYNTLLIFQSYINSSWQMSKEKYLGTFEEIFLTPVNRLKWLYARVIATSILNTILYLIIFILIFIYFIPINFFNLIKLLEILVIVTSSSFIWGGFLTTLFMAFRDGTLIFSLFQDLQECMSGIKIPFVIYPIIMKIIGSLFPLTYTVSLIRNICFGRVMFLDVLTFLLINFIFFILSIFLFKYVESYLQKTGKFNCF